MKFEDLNWMQVEDYLKKDDRIILVLGACEQHGYLSLMTDVKIPMVLGEEASRQTGVLLAPPLNFGCSPYFLTYPGTISLRLHTFLDVVEDIFALFVRCGLSQYFDIKRTWRQYPRQNTPGGVAQPASRSESTLVCLVDDRHCC